MKVLSKLLKPLIGISLVVLVSIQAVAGGMDGGGGTFAHPEFKNIEIPKNILLGMSYLLDFKKLASEYISQAQQLGINPDAVAKLSAALHSKLKFTFDRLDLNGTPVDAKCFRDEKLILLSLVRYPKETDFTVRARLSLHEYAQMARLEGSLDTTFSAPFADQVEKGRYSKDKDTSAKEVESDAQKTSEDAKRELIDKFGFRNLGKTEQIGTNKLAVVEIQGKVYLYLGQGAVDRQEFLDYETGTEYEFIPSGTVQFLIQQGVHLPPDFSKTGFLPTPLAPSFVTRENVNSELQWKRNLAIQSLQNKLNLLGVVQSVNQDMSSWIADKVSTVDALARQDFRKDIAQFDFMAQTAKEIRQLSASFIEDSVQPQLNEALKGFRAAAEKKDYQNKLEYFVIYSALRLMVYKIKNEAEGLQLGLVDTLTSDSGSDPFKAGGSARNDSSSHGILPETVDLWETHLFVHSDKDVADYAEAVFIHDPSAKHSADVKATIEKTADRFWQAMETNMLSTPQDRLFQVGGDQ